MNRNVLLLIGVVCWTAVAADVLLHLMGGDLLVPVALAAVLVVWFGLRVVPARRARALAPAQVADRA